MIHNKTIDAYNSLKSKIPYNHSPEWEQGLIWYKLAYQRVMNWNDSRFSSWTACNIFAISAANTSWISNDKAAENALSGRGLLDVVTKVNRTIAGEQNVIPYNSKTYCFAQNLIGNESFVTVDRHMYRAAGLCNNKGNKEIIQFCITRLASEYRVTCAQLQAMIWLVQIKEGK